MLTVAPAPAALPALSVAVPLAGCAAPSALSGIGAVQLATPEVASAQVNVTVTGVLFQPLPFAGVEVAALIVGAVWSMRIGPNDPGVAFPWVSVAIPFTHWLSPSPLSVTGAGQDATRSRWRSSPAARPRAEAASRRAPAESRRRRCLRRSGRTAASARRAGCCSGPLGPRLPRSIRVPSHSQRTPL